MLLQWLEGFKASFGDNPAAKETLEECENALNLYTKVIEAVRIPLAVKNARRAKRADGSILEYGLDYHLRNFTGSVSTDHKIIYIFFWFKNNLNFHTTNITFQLEKGIPGDPRFPDRDNEWIEARTKDKELLVEWLEDFKSKLGEYQESQETIEECERALTLYKQVVDAVKVPLMVQNARKARRADGCCLEYGLEFHLKNFIGPVCINIILKFISY